jgi:hypothetical protein
MVDEAVLGALKTFIVEMAVRFVVFVKTVLVVVDNCGTCHYLLSRIDHACCWVKEVEIQRVYAIH